MAAKAGLLALDVGDKRIGVALANELGFVRPLTTIVVSDTTQRELASLIEQHGITTIVAGYPRNQDGLPTKQTKKIERYVESLGLKKPIVWQDESLTSRQAEAELSKKRSAHSKEDVDALAAVYILEDYLRSQSS